MSTPEGSARGDIATRWVELAVALLFALVGAIVIADSVRVGYTWAEDGPRAGYFPFYIGLIIVLSSMVNLALAVLRKGPGGGFVERGQLISVLKVLIPAAIFVVATGYLGIYLSAAIYIAVFMIVLGKYPPLRCALLSVAIVTIFFLMFEVWFKVPLYKGSLDPLSFLGY